MLVLGLPFDENSLEQGGLGGSESAAIYMSRALATQGARVTIFCKTKRPSVDTAGVSYVEAGRWPEYARATPHDVCIVQRSASAFAQRTGARLNMLWCHDLAMGRNDQAFRSVLWNVDKTIVLSTFMREQYKQIHGLPNDAFFVSRNGIDLPLFQRLHATRIERDPKKLIFAARPERGLDVLLSHIMPRLLRLDEALQLSICGYHHGDAAADWNELYEECSRLAGELGSRVAWLGSLSKRQLYRHYLSAQLYLYPTPSPCAPNFREVSCISAMEAQAAGLPIVTSSIGALPETISAEAGALVPTSGSLSDYADRFVSAAAHLLKDHDAWARASAAGLAKAASLDWQDVARTWLIEFEELIRRKSGSTDRLARHFRRNGDIASLERLQCSHASPAGNVFRTKATQQDGGSDDESKATALPGLENWLAAATRGVSSILYHVASDYRQALALAAMRKDLVVRVALLDAGSFERATNEAKRLGLAGRTSFELLAFNASPESDREGGLFDAAIFASVLARVREPWTLLGRAEARLHSGANVLLFEGFGCIFPSRTDELALRCWNFDVHDLRDMLEQKPSFEMNAEHLGDEAMGSRGAWIARYVSDRAPVPAIDTERRLWLQGPRQTLSAMLIVGPGAEETLGWTLGSLKDAVDEIVIADCGMTEDARRIAGNHNARLVPGVDPLVAGFDASRNLALDACTGDWCLWIDSDEKLVGAGNLDKYLRENTFHGYCLRQHHFSCDMPVDRDFPVRIFRRRTFSGRSIRFWGLVHEHPEFSLNEGPGPTLALPDVHLAHVGYLHEDGRRERLARNWPLLKLDEERYPERLLQKFFLIRDHVQTVHLALQGTRGVVTDDLKRSCVDAIALYRLHFQGTAGPLRRQALEYYSHAVTVLGQGFEAAYDVSADATAANPGVTKKWRFATLDDFKAELLLLAEERAGRFDQTW